MKVSGSGELKNEALYQYQQTDAAQKGKAVEDKTRAGLVPEDRVNISDRTKDVQVAREAVAKLPDVREDKVNAAKSAIESGTYKVNEEELARKMVLDSIINIFA